VDVVIGLTGPNASGKGEVAAHLGSRGFSLHSLSDIVREQAALQGFPPEREFLIQVGNALRRQEGPGALALRMLPRLRGGRAVVDSIRNPAEVRVLRDSLTHFVLLGVRAPIDLRFRRSLARARPGDPDTLEGFEAREAQENAADPTAQQLDETFRLADRVIDNSGDLARLAEALDRLLGELDRVDGSNPAPIP
jgi:dephospho-CoA kinase